MNLLERITPVPISQYEEEFLPLLKLYKERAPKNILEIGTHHGGTLFHWIKNAPDGANIRAIDNQHINCADYYSWSDHGRVNVDWLKQDSHTQEAYDWAKLPDQYDFIFIDGDHSYKGVKDDWIRYKNLIGPKGIIAFHDIRPHPPYKEWKIEVDILWWIIKQNYNTLEFIGPAVWPDQAGIGVVFFD